MAGSFGWEGGADAALCSVRADAGTSEGGLPNLLGGPDGQEVAGGDEGRGSPDGRRVEQPGLRPEGEQPVHGREDREVDEHRGQHDAAHEVDLLDQLGRLLVRIDPAVDGHDHESRHHHQHANPQSDVDEAHQELSGLVAGDEGDLRGSDHQSVDRNGVDLGKDGDREGRENGPLQRGDGGVESLTLTFADVPVDLLEMGGHEDHRDEVDSAHDAPSDAIGNEAGVREVVTPSGDAEGEEGVEDVSGGHEAGDSQDALPGAQRPEADENQHHGVDGDEQHAHANHGTVVPVASHVRGKDDGVGVDERAAESHGRADHEDEETEALEPSTPVLSRLLEVDALEHQVKKTGSHEDTSIH